MIGNDKGNGMSKYKIGLITADEVAYAGGVYWSSNINSNYYLYTGSRYWTMSPGSFENGGGYMYNIIFSNTGIVIYSGVSNPYGVRPVINLNPNVEVISGNGTSTSPYVIKTS